MSLSEEQVERIDQLLYEVETDEEFDEIFKHVSDKYELHELASQINWDDGYHALHSVADHENIDYGTALLLYWYGQPDYFTKFDNEAEVEDYNRENYVFVKKLEDMLLKNHFASNSIIYDPMEDIPSVTERSKLLNNKGIPDQLKRSNT